MSKQRDQVRIGPEIRPGVRVGVRRNESGERQVLMSQIKDGEPLLGREAAIVHSECHDGWHDLTSLSGPPQVATPAYRAGYDRIFGKKPTVGEA